MLTNDLLLLTAPAVEDGAPPVITIVKAPADQEAVDYGTSIDLEASATDAEDGDLDVAITYLYQGDLVETVLGTNTATLEPEIPGPITFIFRATDDDGNVTTVSRVVNVTPVVAWVSPPSGAVLRVGVPVELVATVDPPSLGDPYPVFIFGPGGSDEHNLGFGSPYTWTPEADHRGLVTIRASATTTGGVEGGSNRVFRVSTGIVATRTRTLRSLARTR